MPPIVRLTGSLLLGVCVTGGMTVLNAHGYVNEQLSEIT